MSRVVSQIAGSFDLLFRGQQSYDCQFDLLGQKVLEMKKFTQALRVLLWRGKVYSNLFAFLGI